MGVAVDSLSFVACCRVLVFQIHDWEGVVGYNPVIGGFHILDTCRTYRSFEDASTVTTLVYFCPWCGKAFPQHIDERLWEEECQRRFDRDLDDPWWRHPDNEHLLPEDLRTDGWWRNKGIVLQPNKPYDILQACARRLAEVSSEKERKIVLQIIADIKEEQKHLQGACCLGVRQEMDKNFDCDVNPEYTCPRTPILFDAATRRFFLTSIAPFSLAHKESFVNKDDSRQLYVQMVFCVWCGKPLPKSLSAEWLKIVREKFGLQDVSDPEELAKLPEKYRTDEWWKELGL